MINLELLSNLVPNNLFNSILDLSVFFFLLIYQFVTNLIPSLGGILM